jgi:hypothetical protein
VKVSAPLRRAGVLLTGFILGFACGSAGAGLLFSLGTLALSFACVEVTARLNEE